MNKTCAEALIFIAQQKNLLFLALIIYRQTKDSLLNGMKRHRPVKDNLHARCEV